MLTELTRSIQATSDKFDQLIGLLDRIHKSISNVPAETELVRRFNKRQQITFYAVANSTEALTVKEVCQLTGRGYAIEALYLFELYKADFLTRVRKGRQFVYLSA